uniref:Uncharacterized protein n=1 Tax=Salix viminalis TaxID=40686 RepID=A0A6N2KAY9_SALVM
MMLTVSRKFTRQLQEDGTRISMLLQFDTLTFWRESQISFALQLLFSSGNPCNLKYLNFGSLNLLLSSPITPSSSDLFDTLIFWRESQISFALQLLFSSGNPCNLKDLNFGSLNLLLSSPITPSSSDFFDTLIFWRESQITFALQLLFSSGNPCNLTDLNFGSLNLLLSSPITPSSSDLVPPMISFIFPQLATFISSRFTRQLQEDGTRISMLLHSCTSGNPSNLNSLNFGSLNLLLSSPITPSSSDLVPPMISFIFPQESTYISSRFTRQLQEDGTRISMLLQFDTLNFWRESQISFALQLLFSSGNPLIFKDLNFGSFNLLLSAPITPSSSDLVPLMISFIFPQ